VITVNSGKGDTYEIGTVSVDMAPLLRLNIDNHNRAVLFKFMWVASHFADLTDITRPDDQRHLLESLLAAPKKPTPP
jgi:hypothetical protein